jgi:DNA-binding NtrC family response regulator
MVVLTEGEQAFQASARRLSLAKAPSQGTPTEGLRDIARRGAREAERRALAEVLDRVHWNRSEAARILRVSYKTLLNKISESGLFPPTQQSL